MDETSKTVAALRAENETLRRIYDDERAHVAALRETVRQLKEELSRLESQRNHGRDRMLG